MSTPVPNDVPVRGFHHLSQAWYAHANLKDADIVDEILVGLYYPDGGCEAELAIRWHDLGQDAPSPRVETFDDSWSLLVSLGDVFKAVAELDGKAPSPDTIKELLVGLGFQDRTDRRAGS